MSLCLNAEEREIVGEYTVDIPIGEGFSGTEHDSHRHTVKYYTHKRTYKAPKELPPEAFKEVYDPGDPATPLAYIFKAYLNHIMMIDAIDHDGAVQVVRIHFAIEEKEAKKFIKDLAKLNNESNKELNKWRKNHLCPTGGLVRGDDAYTVFDELQDQRDLLARKYMQKFVKNLAIPWENFEEGLRHRYSTRTGGFARFNHKPYWEATDTDINTRMEFICSRMAEEY